MLTRCAAAVADMVAVIKSLITMAHVLGFDETALWCSKVRSKKYVLPGSTENATAYHLGGPDLDSFAEFGILPTSTEWPYTTVTPTNSTLDGIGSPGISPARRSCCATSPMRPNPAPMRIGNALRGLIAPGVALENTDRLRVCLAFDLSLGLPHRPGPPVLA